MPPAERGRQLPQLLLIELRRSRRHVGRNVALDALYGFEREIPTPLKFAGDTTVRRIAGIVLAAGMSRLVARLLLSQLVLALCRCDLTGLSFDRLRGCVDAKRLNDPQDLVAVDRVDLDAADRHASLRAVVRTRAIAGVAPDVSAVVPVRLPPQWPKRCSQQSPCATRCGVPVLDGPIWCRSQQ